ncbi:hypothetical protein [Liquorilactobacillus hordei]|uniref:hypothetical protein n=1 Tax=Liquorilactobacillus hordei TaxID=468911 RepID=UPI0039E8A242
MIEYRVFRKAAELIISKQYVETSNPSPDMSQLKEILYHQQNSSICTQEGSMMGVYQMPDARFENKPVRFQLTYLEKNNTFYFKMLSVEKDTFFNLSVNSFKEYNINGDKQTEKTHDVIRLVEGVSNNEK